MDTLGIVHTVFGFAALGFGLVVVRLRKGTRLHRTAGHMYVSSMIGLNATALAIYNLFGGFGPFHVGALASLATLIAGMVPVISRRPRRGWLDLHARLMAWSYAGLLAAAAAEAASRVPGAPFATSVAASTLLVIAGAAVLIEGRDGAVLRRAMQRAGRARGAGRQRHA